MCYRKRMYYIWTTIIWYVCNDLAICWVCLIVLGPALCMFWICFGHVSGMLWACVKTRNEQNLEMFWKYSMVFLCIRWDHWVWLCVSEAVCLWCCLPLEPKLFTRLTVGGTNTQTDRQTDRHISTMTRPCLGAGPSEKKSRLVQKIWQCKVGDHKWVDCVLCFLNDQNKQTYG